MRLSIEQRVVRIAARELVAVEVRSGRMKRGPCERCGAVKTDGHHDDYSKPLSVRWLCREHHLAVHRESGTSMGGRQPRAGSAATKLVGFRLSIDERSRTERCAELAGLDLSALIRRGIEQQCKAIEKRGKR